MQLFCLPSLMLRSLHLIEVESIVANKKKNVNVSSRSVKIFDISNGTNTNDLEGTSLQLLETFLIPVIVPIQRNTLLAGIS